MHLLQTKRDVSFFFSVYVLSWADFDEKQSTVIGWKWKIVSKVRCIALLSFFNASRCLMCTSCVELMVLSGRWIFHY